MDLMFNARQLRELAAKHRAQYRNNEPFPHIVIDNFLPDSVASRLPDAFPDAGIAAWEHYDADNEVKLQISSESAMDTLVRETLYQLNSSMFIEFLEELTGIEGLVADPHLEGGGLHQIERGGFLNIHADFNYHPRLRLDRRINVLIYLNKDWRDEYNGHLELWNRDMTKCALRVAPILNRCVIFNTTDFAYHGHPDPLQCPEGMRRKSLALYYYSNGRPAEEISEEHTTLFRHRPNENQRAKNPAARKAKRFAKKLVPPIVIDLFKLMRK